MMHNNDCEMDNGNIYNDNLMSLGSFHPWDNPPKVLMKLTMNVSVLRLIIVTTWHG